MLRHITFGAAFFCALCAASAHGSIINGDFETGDLTGWTVVGSVPWATVGVEDDGEGGYRAAWRFEFDSPSPPAATLQLRQAFTVPDVPHYLTFDFDASINATVNHPAGLLATVVTLELPGYSAQVNHTGGPTGSFSWLLNPGSYSLVLAVTHLNLPGMFPGVTNASGFSILDNVTLTVIPEPSSLLLALCGVVAIHLGNRFRSKSACRLAPNESEPRC